MFENVASFNLKYWYFRLHGVCQENPLAPVISRLGLPLYRTSGDNSVLYDHDLERWRFVKFSFMYLVYFDLVSCYSASLIAASNANLCSGIKAWLDIVIIILSGYACWMINDHSREIGFICKIVLFLFKSTAESWRQWWSVWFRPICGKFWPQLN